MLRGSLLVRAAEGSVHCCLQPVTHSPQLTQNTAWRIFFKEGTLEAAVLCS